MADIPERDLEETRAALAPTLEATAAILPWVAKPAKLRFEAKLNQRWIAACKRLAEAWSARHEHGDEEVRPAIFTLYGIALESGDADCLHFGEALASAADALETANGPISHLIAALSASIECFNEPGGLENPLFGERARHFAQRLESSRNNTGRYSPRSPVLDQLFVSEAGERLERLHDALDALPPDAYALKLEAQELAQQAEHLELFGIVHLCRQLLGNLPDDTRLGELDSPARQAAMRALLLQLETLIAGISP